MALVHEPIELSSPPGQTNRESRVQCGCDALQSLDGHALNTASLDPGDSLLAHAGRRAQISLTPTPASAQHTDSGAKTLPVHARQHGGEPFPPT